MTMKKKDFLTVIRKWNIEHPYDRWWREKHKVALFSPKHRAMCPIDMLMEYEEDTIYEQLREDHSKERSEEEDKFAADLMKNPGVDQAYIPGKGNFLASSEDSMSQEDKDKYEKTAKGFLVSGIIFILFGLLLPGVGGAMVVGGFGNPAPVDADASLQLPKIPDSIPLPRMR